MSFLFRGLTAAAVLGALIAGTTNAKIPDEVRNRIYLKFGAVSPTHDKLRDVGGVWWTGGAEVLLNSPDDKKVNSVELLYTSKEASSGASETTLTSTTITLNRKIRVLSAAQSVGEYIFYYGGGLGLNFSKAKVSDDATPANSVNSSKTSGCAKVFVGYEVAHNLEVEAQYNVVFRTNGAFRNDGIYFLLGVKF